MATIPQVAKAMKRVLSDTTDVSARETGFVQRASKITGAVFAQTTVLGWLHNPDATLVDLTQTAATLGVSITPQALDQRFTSEAAAFLKRVLDAAVGEVISADPVTIPLLNRFHGVSIQDSSVITLPDTLAEIWSGCSGDGSTAAIKIQVRFDFLTGSLLGPLLQDGRSQDKNASTQAAALPAGALRLADLGYFNLDVLQHLDAEGVFFLSRLQFQTVVYDEDGKRLDLLPFLKEECAGELDMPVRIGGKHRFSVRLLAVHVPEEVGNRRRQQLKEDARHKAQPVSKRRLALADWTVLVTNAPVALLSLAEALILARIRWQIELLFKLWKQHGKIDKSRSGNHWRILCELYAKLIAMVIQHWLFLISFWAYPNRSLVRAAQTVRSYALMLASALAGVIEISIAISQISTCLSLGCRMNRRKKQPNAYQLLLEAPKAA
jgi:hypothetical protein